MSAIVDALLSELDEQALARLARRLAPYLEPAAPGPDLLTADEAAEVLRCKRKRIYELAQRGTLRSVRDGGRILIPRDAIDFYLAGNREQHKGYLARERQRKIGFAEYQRNRVTPVMRSRIFVRDGKYCRACGATDTDFHVDHIVPVSKGGTSDEVNLQVLCARCNMAKGARVT